MNGFMFCVLEPGPVANGSTTKQPGEFDFSLPVTGVAAALRALGLGLHVVRLVASLFRTMQVLFAYVTETEQQVCASSLSRLSAWLAWSGAISEVAGASAPVMSVKAVLEPSSSCACMPLQNLDRYQGSCL